MYGDQEGCRPGSRNATKLAPGESWYGVGKGTCLDNFSSVIDGLQIELGGNLFDSTKLMTQIL
jgi:hypothetical protein